MEKSRALKKLKKSLPASPSKRCAVISTYLSRRSPESPTVLNLRKSISISNIQEIVESAKLKRSKEALTVMNTMTASVRKILKNLGVKCNFANNWVFRPGEFQAENESELKY